MCKKAAIAALIALAVLLATGGPILADSMTKVKISEAMKTEVLVDPASLPQSTGTGIPLNQDLTLTSPGYIVGYTHYDFQVNCSAGHRIAKDSLDGIHVVWMNGIDYWSGNRWIYYNFRDENGAWAWGHTGTQVNPPPQGAGYVQLSLLPDGRAVPAYHTPVDYTVVAVDVLRGFGVFTELDVPEDGYYWPYETIDRHDRIHMICSTIAYGGEFHLEAYTRSDDEGYTWTNPVLWDTLMCTSGVLSSSRVSDKVCVAFTHPRDLIDPDQFNNNVCYYESLDGVTWNFNGGLICITNYQITDTLRAYCEVDAIYDFNDNLHITWTTPYYDEIGGFISVDACLLWHWSEATGITMIANGWSPSSPGAWNRTISKMSLGVSQNDDLFALWTQFDDYDKSVGGYSNGELCISYSTDGGATWSDSINITNSPTPDCWPGECDSDHWSTLNEVVDDSLYITYINDKDPGGIPQTEGVDTENPVMYLAVANPISEVSMSCEAITPVFCQGKNFYFSLTVSNNSAGSVSGILTFTGYAGYDCVTVIPPPIPRPKTYAPGETVQYYYFKVPRVPPGPYSASIGGTLGGYDLFCCMNVDIVPCQGWRIGDNTEWELVEIDRPEFQLPTVTSLSQNYPNPFNANTSISYTLAQAGNVNLSVYDITGRLVAILAEGHQEAGEHSTIWDALEFSSGVYFYKLSTADYTATKKMHLLK